MSDLWCPLQARIVLCYRGWRPYMEPLRALPLPEALYSPLRNHWRQIYCAPTRSRITDRGEVCILAALDSAERMEAMDQETLQALGCLQSDQRDMINALAAYAGSDCQFDFGAAAHAWTEGKRGKRPAHSGGIGQASPYYTAWVTAKAKKRRRYVEGWLQCEKSLRGYFDAPEALLCGCGQKGLDRQG